MRSGSAGSSYFGFSVRFRYARLTLATVPRQSAAQPAGAHHIHLVWSRQRGVGGDVVAGSTRPANHVQVQLRDDAVDGHGRKRCDVARAPAAAFLARVPDKQQRPLRPRASHRRSRHLHERHHARAVIVGAVVDDVRRLVGRRAAGAIARGRCRPVGRGAVRVRPGGAKADVIEVRAERDELGPQHRVGPLDAGNDIEGVFAHHAGADGKRDLLGRGERKRRAGVL